MSLFSNPFDLLVELTDICVKNSGSLFLSQVASEEFVECLTDLLYSQTSTNLLVRKKILELIQVWGIAFKGNSELYAMTAAYESLKGQGYQFPELNVRVSSALIETRTAPEWTESDYCTRCREAFSTFNRKHHCRNCGHTFCQKCSSKTSTLPHFSIMEPVRVCDGCFGNSNQTRPVNADPLKSRPVNADPLRRNSDDDLQRAIELSKQEFKSTSTSAPKADEYDKDLEQAIKLSLQTPQPSVTQVDVASFSSQIDQMEQQSNVYGPQAINLGILQAPFQQATIHSQKLASILQETALKYELNIELSQKMAEASRLYDQWLDRRLSGYLSYPVPSAVPATAAPVPHQPLYYQDSPAFAPVPPQTQPQLQMQAIQPSAPPLEESDKPLIEL